MQHRFSRNMKTEGIFGTFEYEQTMWAHLRPLIFLCYFSLYTDNLRFYFSVSRQ